MVEISIPLFDVEDMKTGRGGGRRGGGKKYAKYDAAIEPVIGFLKDAIAGSKDGTIRVKTSDLAKQMSMAGRHETSIYWGTKFVLFGRGIVVTTGQTKTGDPVLVMREKKEGDTLPASLAKYLEGVEEEVGGEVEEKVEEKVEEEGEGLTG